MKVGIKKICSSRTFHIFSAKRDTGTSSDLNIVYLQFMRQINDCISEFVMGMGWLPTGQVSDLEITRILFFTFSIIFVFIPEKSSRLQLFSAVFLAERFFYKVELIILYKKMKLAFGEGNNNEHQLIAAIKLKTRLQAFCFISRRSVEWHCKFAFGTFNTTLNI